MMGQLGHYFSWLQRAFLDAVRRRHRLLLAYVVSEIVCYWRFRVRMARLQLPRHAYRRGTLRDLRWLLEALSKRVGALKLSKESLQQYLDQKSLDQGHRDSIGSRCSPTWEHYYVMVQDSFCIVGPSPEEHKILLEIAAACAKRNNLPLPGKTEKPPSCDAPVAFGSAPLHVVHKPIPIELALASTRLLFDMAFRFVGFQGHWIPTPEGWIRYWLHMPRKPDPHMLPIVFIHGVGLGAAPYLPFLHRLRRGRHAPLIAIELPNCSRCSFQSAMPSASSFRDAMERLLRSVLGIETPGSYMLIGHSLGTDFCSMIMNDPRLSYSDSPLRPARLVLLDPVCFAHEIAEAHRLPFWTLREALSHCGKRWWRWPIQFMILLLVIRDEYNQEATKRAIVPGTDSIFRCPVSLLRLCPVLVCLSGNDQAVPAWKIHDYLREQFPDMEVRIDPGLEHGGFLMPTSPAWIVNSHAKDVLGFLKQDTAKMSKVSSQPGTESLESGLILSRKSRSELNLKA